MTGTFRVLHVCTGNLCRSPLAEHLTRRGLASRLGVQAAQFEVASAGTHGSAGAPMERHALDLLAEGGVDGSAFRSRALVAEHVAQADAVLVAAREHRVAVVALVPDAASRTFTLREFARLAAVVDVSGLPVGRPVERARALVEAVAAQRRSALRPREDDLSDPYRRPRRSFEVCARAIHQALDLPLDLVAGRQAADR